MPTPNIDGLADDGKYADSVVELDARIGHIMDKLRELDLDQNTMVFYTTDNGAWQDVYPDAGYTPFRGTKGTVREGGNRVPAIAVMPGKVKPGSKSHDIVGGLDLMATFASVSTFPCQRAIDGRYAQAHARRSVVSRGFLYTCAMRRVSRRRPDLPTPLRGSVKSANRESMRC